MADPTGTNTAPASTLPVGTTGQILGLGSTGAAQWVGGMVLLNTLLPSNVATVGDTTSLSSTYFNYMVTFANVAPATNSAVFQLQVATTGSTFISGGYFSIAQGVVGAGGVTDTNTTVILMSGSRATNTVGNATTYGVNGSILIFNPSGAAARKQVHGSVSYLNGTTSGLGDQYFMNVFGYQDSTNAVTGLQFSFNSGNIQTGTIRIYGMY
jgi:hypothetical protein